MSVILTLNAGSSSIKFGVHETGDEPPLLASGQVENLGPLARLTVKGKPAREIGPADHAVALRAILNALSPVLEGREVRGVGHRIVHGGKSFGDPSSRRQGVEGGLSIASCCGNGSQRWA